MARNVQLVQWVRQCPFVPTKRMIVMVCNSSIYFHSQVFFTSSLSFLSFYPHPLDLLSFTKHHIAAFILSAIVLIPHVPDRLLMLFFIRRTLCSYHYQPTQKIWNTSIVVENQTFLEAIGVEVYCIVQHFVSALQCSHFNHSWFQNTDIDLDGGGIVFNSIRLWY